MRPKVGFIVVRPWAFPGPSTEPPVWVPIPATARRAATAVPVPEDEPPGEYPTWSGVHAFRVVGVVVP